MEEEQEEEVFKHFLGLSFVTHWEHWEQCWLEQNRHLMVDLCFAEMNIKLYKSSGFD